MLGIGIVDRNDRIAQHSFLGHGAQADHPGGRLFRSPNDAVYHVRAFGVQNIHQVGAIVHGDVRLVIDGRQDVLVISLVVLALDGEHRDVVVAHQAGGHIVLGRQRIGGAQYHVRPTITQADRQICGLGSDVQAG